MVNQFTIQEIERTIEFEDDGEDYSEDYTEGTPELASFRAALNVLELGCWDSLDVRKDGTIICYPADSTQNMRTGTYESTHVIIKARRPEWSERLVNTYDARKVTK